MSKLFEKLTKVQLELKAPKNQRNTFGKYNYRSKEDILEAAKPLCIKNGLCLTINDELVLIGDRYYIKATATITETIVKGESFSVSAYAREALTKKGMDESQITGAVSSYAGKYALNNLFGIDDTKDADATNIDNNSAKKPMTDSSVKSSGKPSAKKPMTDTQKENFMNGIKKGKFDLVEKHLKNYKNDDEYKEVLKVLNKAKNGE